MTHRLPVSLVVLASLWLPGSTAPARAQASGAMRVVAGGGTAGFADGRGPEARFNKPIRLAPFGDDAILVADIFNHALRVVGRDGLVRTLAGGPEKKGHEDGPAASARFAAPHGVGTAADGRVAVAEAENHTLRILTPSPQVGSGYVVTTLAGTPGKSGAQDGPSAQALFNSPHAALWGEDGALYVPDIGNAAIRRVKAGAVETVAREGETFVYPMDVAWMKDGRLVVADAGAHRLRTWAPGRPVTTLPLQGPLSTPHGVASGPDGTLYVADMRSHRVLAIDGQGRLTTVAGVAGEAGADAAHLNRPAAVLVHAGWLWIADLDNHRICAVPLR